MKNYMLDEYNKIYGYRNGVNVYFAPGRVNLIGEHTDYNGGHVFPCALTVGTYAAVSKRDDNILRFYSLNFSDYGVIESNLDDLIPNPDAHWTNYPKGVMWAFKERGMTIPCGMDILIYGDIPNGSGLSSSASLEVLTGFFLRDLFKFDVSNIDLAVIGQYSENNFNGMNCGIMDQFASSMGLKDNAIFLDTSDLSYEYAPIKLDGMKIVVTNSKVKHSLVDSAYNDRRSSCETALGELKKVIDIKSLGDLATDDFEKYKDAIKDSDRIKKAKHAVYENQRTIRAVKALKDGDIDFFGKLMTQSHISLRDDYDVSCEEINVLVDAALSVNGVLGSRITGGGFGGCTVSIVKDDALESFKNTVTAAYREHFDKEPEIYVVSIGNGPCKL